MSKITQDEALDLIAEGDTDAYDLLTDADPKFSARFKRIDKSIVKLLADVKQHFPDATYYTASGGFNLMLGDSHGEYHNGCDGSAQAQLIAMSGRARIGDGDF